MLTLLSPAKTLDFDSPSPFSQSSECAFLTQAAQLIDQLKQYAPHEIAKLMDLSPALSELNVARYQSWRLPFPQDQAKQAIFAFQGDVYQGLEAQTLSSKELEFAQSHLRILSGLYGVLKPLDWMLPYRLEMGTKLANAKGKDLYAFWGESLTEHLNEQLAQSGSKVVVNLASNEYFSAIKAKKLNAKLITPVFKDEKNGQFKIVSFYAKKARGLMARYIVQQGLNDDSQLHRFDVAGYRFSEEDSNESTLVFKRKEKDIPHA